MNINLRTLPACSPLILKFTSWKELGERVDNALAFEDWQAAHFKKLRAQDEVLDALDAELSKKIRRSLAARKREQKKAEKRRAAVLAKANELMAA